MTNYYLPCLLLLSFAAIGHCQKPWYHAAIRAQHVQQQASNVMSQLGEAAYTNGWNFNEIVDSLTSASGGTSRMHGMLTQIKSIGDQMHSELSKYVDIRMGGDAMPLVNNNNLPVFGPTFSPPVYQQPFLPTVGVPERSFLPPVVNRVASPMYSVRGSLQDVAGPFLRSEIVPDLLPVAPKHTLLVRFANGETVEMGKEVRAESTAFPPVFVHWPTEYKQLYTMLMFDIGPKDTNNTYVHWLITNVGANLKLSQGDLHVEYMQSNAPAATPNRRYVYLVYKQGAHIDKASAQIPYITAQQMRPRSGFNLASFVNRFQLGLPLAGNFYTSSCDASVRSSWARVTDVQMGEPGC